jgi:transposase
MEYGAIDLHTKESQIRIVTAEGVVVLDRRIPTRAERLTGLFGDRPRLRVLLETGTESEWVAQHLEELGHEVVVADPNYAPMYSDRTRRVKTDKRDVAALAEANRLGLYRRAHRVSAAHRVRRQQLRVREHAVRMRTQTINVLRALLRQHGVRIPTGAAEHTVARVARLALPPILQEVIAPLLELLDVVTPLIARADRWARETARTDTAAQRLLTVPGVGPIVALTFQAVLDTPDRFGGAARRASAYVGVVPSERSSGERQRRGAVTKAGPRTLRALLVQAAWAVWRAPGRAGAALHAWVLQLAARRGRRVAVVALARRLSRILYAIWRDGTTFRIGAPRPVAA